MKLKTTLLIWIIMAIILFKVEPFFFSDFVIVFVIAVPILYFIGYIAEQKGLL